MNIIITGIQGSGKGTQSKLLSEQFKLVHISFGDLIRHHLEHNPELVAPYSLERYNKGELATDDVLFRVADSVLKPITELSKLPFFPYKGFILDGFPRTEGQLKYVIDNYHIDKCILLELDENVCIERLLIRGRSDDTPEGIKKRLSSYKEKTQPIFNIFANDGRLITVDANKSVYELNVWLYEVLRELDDR